MVTPQVSSVSSTIKNEVLDVKNCILLWYLKMQSRKMTGMVAMALMNNPISCSKNSKIKIMKLAIATKHLFIL
jgi:hypothetical protein